MSKLNYELKIKIYEERMNGSSIQQLSEKYQVNRSYIKYFINLIRKHGYEGLRKSQNRIYLPEEKLRIVLRVINGTESINSIALDEGLSSSATLIKWIENYNKNGHNIVEKRGISTMKKKRKPISNTERDELEKLRKENKALKMELEYGKKLRAVVQARNSQQLKKK